MATLPPAVIVDLDGTLCDATHRRKYVDGTLGKKDWDSFYGGIGDDQPNPLVISVLNLLMMHCGFKPIFVTGRPEKYRTVTNNWLVNLNVQFLGRALLMRKDGDFRPDDTIKEEIYNEQIKGIYHVHLVLDDRNRVVNMWRRLGLECWQVAEGDF